MAIQTKLRRWGNSFGIVIPSEVMRVENFKEGEEVIVEVSRKENLKKVFGSLKDWKVNSQELKNQAREDWE